MMAGNDSTTPGFIAAKLLTFSVFLYRSTGLFCCPKQVIFQEVSWYPFSWKGRGSKVMVCTAIVLLLLVRFGQSTTVQNCTTSPCDLNCSGSTKCQQDCDAAACGISCNSTGGCDSKCHRGGCSAMTCHVSPPSKNDCSQTCEKDCQAMDCNAFICRPECAKENCKMTCEGQNNSLCYPKCHGKNCEINCKSTNCEAICSGGGCRVRFAKGSSGTLACPSNCTFTCAKGSVCIYVSGSGNVTLVDDPFAVPTMKPATTKPSNVACPAILPTVLSLVVYAFSIIMLQT